MKKILVAFALMNVAGIANAATAYAPGADPAEAKPEPTTYTYTVAAARADRMFVKNNFDFTLSTNVIMVADEDPDGAFMAVGTGNTAGRNTYIGHSNGGSVGACGDPLTATEAKTSGAVATKLGTDFLITDATGCTQDTDPS